jgi:Uma2 family endonuclease
MGKVYLGNLRVGRAYRPVYTLSMPTIRPATITDLVATPEKAELIGGKLVFMSPTGFAPGFAATQIVVSLSLYSRSQPFGVALGDNVGFRVQLPHRESFSPDAAFYAGKPQGMKFLDGAPLFAVEVRSESDYGPQAERDIAAKRSDYFAAGTQVVWDVDLLSHDVVRVYRASNPLTPVCYSHGQEAEAEPALPGWRFAVNELYAQYWNEPQQQPEDGQ